QRAKIPGVNAMFDHDFAGALRDHDEAVEVAEAALTFRQTHEIEELPIVPGLGEPGDAGIVDVRFLQRADIRDADLSVVAISAVAAQGAERLLPGRKVRYTCDQLAFVFQTDERRPDRDAAD